jgi:hypothetical protein
MIATLSLDIQWEAHARYYFSRSRQFIHALETEFVIAKANSES